MDQKLLFLINREWTSPALDSFMALMSSFAAWAPVLLVIVAVVAIAGGFRARAMLLTLGLVVAVSDGAVCSALKRMVNRPRPREALAGVRVVDLQPSPVRFLAVFKPAVVESSPTPKENAHGHSFPSSHTANTFGAATVITLFYRRRGWIWFLPAAIVGYSRVYVGAHWPSDVLLSIPLAIGITVFFVFAVASAWRKYGARLAPRIHARHPGLLEAVA
jgi:undecaprenyl-diphosphatase